MTNMEIINKALIRNISKYYLKRISLLFLLSVSILVIYSAIYSHSFSEDIISNTSLQLESIYFYFPPSSQLAGTTVENKGKLILTEIFPSVQKHDIF